MTIKKKTSSINRILFLYAEITPYFLDSIENFTSNNKNFFIHVVYLNVFRDLIIREKPQSKYTPQANFSSSHGLVRFVDELNPSLILISGRMNSDYLKIAKLFYNKTLRITVQDTMFRNSLRQYFQRLFRNYLYKQYFDKFWGVGTQQTKYAKSIGFKGNEIYSGFYVAAEIFFKSYKKKFFSTNDSFNFLFIGRLVKEKNILRLSKAIELINNKLNSKHKLIIIGEGYLRPKLEKFDCVTLLGLKSQKEIIKISDNCDIFCLPSIYEPWGVVVHEMTALGFPIICSKNCGSSFDLVEDGVNGYKFNPYNINSIKDAILKITCLSNKQLDYFSSKSNLIAKKINHENWNKTLISMIN
ncbi:glycosyltransferase [Flavobacteriaceae bacterium]|nr:glycosyltransferase [Flavobacteriaceae bacterium]